MAGSVTGTAANAALVGSVAGEEPDELVCLPQPTKQMAATAIVLIVRLFISFNTAS